MPNYAVNAINIECEPAGDSPPALIVICDTPSMQGWNAGQCMTPKQKASLIEMLGPAAQQGVVYISPCRPMSDEIKEREAEQKSHLAADAEDFLEALAYYSGTAKAVITLGKHGLRQAAARPAKITKERGSFHTYERTGNLPVMPVQSPANALARPELKPIIESDLKQVAKLAEAGWVLSSVMETAPNNYEWRIDIQDLLDDPPEALAVDTETLGTIWHGRQAILTVQMSWEEGQGIAIPFNLEYWNNDELRSPGDPPKLTPRNLQRLQNQVRQLLQNPNVRVTGHNFKFDWHHFRQYGITVAGWEHDTIQLCHAVDENMQLKSLDECTRRWIPALAGYADAFGEDPIHCGKSRMDLVPHDKMLLYSVGDTDSCLRLTKVLLEEARKDMRNYRVYEKVKMPALKYLFTQAEEFGLPVDREALYGIAAGLKVRVAEMEKSILQEAAEQWPAVMRRHAGKLKLSRPDLIRDLLFSEDGLNLTPVVATKKTRMLAPEEQLESTSKKDHLPYFDHIPIVQKLIEFSTIASLLKNFAGRPQEAEWERVKRTVSGKWPKRLAEAAARAGIQLPTGMRFRSAAVEQPNETSQTFFIGETTYAVCGNEVFRLEVEEAKGLIWFTENVDETAIHPDYNLHTAVTGRSACRQPNLQNQPNRGDEAKEFRKAYKAREGYTLIEGDLSQAELRVVAVMANETTMLRIYRENGDIHVTTAQSVKKLSTTQWRALSKKEQKENRQLAKAVNFGLCIAEGQRVLTLQDGYVPIEQVRDFHLLWDGVEWVSHDGVIYKGGKEVITWDGVTATPDHKVFTDGGRVSLQTAADRHYCIVTTATDDGAPVVWDGKHSGSFPITKLGKPSKPKMAKVYDIMNAGPRRRFTCEGRLVSNCFGMFWKKLASYAKTSYGVVMNDRQAESAYSAYFALYSKLSKWHANTKEFVRKNKFVRSLHGALRRLVAVDSVEEGTRKEAERQGINAPVQGFSSDLGLMAGIMFANGCNTDSVRVIGFIHDALIIEARTEIAEQAAAWLRWTMENQPLEQWFNLRLPIPILADVKIGSTLSAMTERPDIKPIRPPWVAV